MASTTYDERTPLLSSISPAPISDHPSSDGKPIPPLTVLAKSLGALQAGKLPSNEQVVAFAAWFLEREKEWEAKIEQRAGGKGMSEVGRRVVRDFRDVVVNLKKFVEEKNANDNIQNFVYHLSQSHVAMESKIDLPSSSSLPSPPPAPAIKSDLQTLLDSVSKLIFSSLQSASLETGGMVDEIVWFGREMVGSAFVGVGEGIAAVGVEVKEGAPEKGKGADGEMTEKPIGEVTKEHFEKGKEAMREFGEKLAEVKDGVSQDAVEKARDRVRRRFDRFLNRLNSDPEAQESFQNVLDLLETYVKFVAEAAEKTAEAASTIVKETEVDVEIRDEEDHYKKAAAYLKDFLNRLAGGELDEEGKGKVDRITEKSNEVVRMIRDDEEVRGWFGDLQSFLNRCAKDPGWALNSTEAPGEFDRLWEKGSELLLADEDGEDGKPDGVVNGDHGQDEKKGKIQKEEGDDEHRRVKRLRKGLRVKVSELLDEVSDFFKSIREDETVRELFGAWSRVATDVQEGLKGGVRAGLEALKSGTREVRQGAKEVRGMLWRDLMDFGGMVLVGVLKEIPVPRTEFKSPKLDFILDDVVITSASFLPDYIYILSKTEMTFHPSPPDLIPQQRRGQQNRRERQKVEDLESAEFGTSGRLRVQGIRFGAKDISFWVRRKKTWFPFLNEESGLLDIKLGGRGLDVDVKFTSVDEEEREAMDEGRFFSIDHVNVKLHDFDFKIRKSRHPVLMFLLRPFARLALRKILERTLEGQIREALTNIDKRIYAIHSTAERKMERNRRKKAVEAYLEAAWAGLKGEKEAVPPSLQPPPPPEEGGEEEGGLLEGVKVTKKGIIKDEPDKDYVIAIGMGSQLFNQASREPEDQDVGGPKRGSHGEFGRGSLGRIREQADSKAKKAADEARKVGSRVEGVEREVRDTGEVVGQIWEGTKREVGVLRGQKDREREEDEKESGWRSGAFNLVVVEEVIVTGE